MYFRSDQNILYAVSQLLHNMNAKWNLITIEIGARANLLGTVTFRHEPA